MLRKNNAYRAAFNIHGAWGQIYGWAPTHTLNCLGGSLCHMGPGLVFPLFPANNSLDHNRHKAYYFQTRKLVFKFCLFLQHFHKAYCHKAAFLPENF